MKDSRRGGLAWLLLAVAMLAAFVPFADCPVCQFWMGIPEPRAEYASPVRGCEACSMTGKVTLWKRCVLRKGGTDSHFSPPAAH
jgi:hypothetical protein